eukprot:TRINITY_DN33551_c0_g1_i1.p1 TRINITY_DN33551_c0_g1~~TRINITY_DN33551_c0_g1_i1.p1  ORF type:complete len:2472 (-),score=462.07 TRINITY_DN33551_c0_g1_i1:1-7416(-)
MPRRCTHLLLTGLLLWQVCGKLNEARRASTTYLSEGDHRELARASLALVAPAAEQVIPAVLAFKTSAEAYPVASGGSALVLRFLDLSKVEPYFANGSSLRSSELLSSSAEGSQSTCGLVLLEAWSSQQDLGFPVPRRCRLRPWIDSTTQSLDFEIEFEPRNGLLEQTAYQLVFNVRTALGVSLTSELLWVIATDDLQQKPGIAVETGPAGIVVAGFEGALAVENSTGANITDVILQGDASNATGTELIEFSSSTEELHLKLVGSAQDGVIAGSEVRVLFWPLTQWQLSEAMTQATCKEPYSCTVEQLEANETNETEAIPFLPARVGAVESIVVSQNNSLILPNLTVTLNGSVVNISQNITPTFVLPLSGSVFAGGSFAARPAVLVLRAGQGNAVQYVHPTAGPALYKSDPGYGMVVRSRGDGNANPALNAGNTLYIRLILSSGLPFGGSIVLAPPAGQYSGTACGNVTALAPNTSLGFGNPPWGDGVLREGSWEAAVDLDASGWWDAGESAGSTCAWRYTAQSGPEGHHAILPGSSVYFEVGVRNPAQEANISWRLGLQKEATSGGLLMRRDFEVPAFVIAAVGEGVFGTFANLVSAMSFAQVLPGSVIAGEQQTLQVFFTASKRVYPRGGLEVEAPPGFDFGLQCAWGDLALEFYRNGDGPSFVAIERLPRVEGCTVFESKVKVQFRLGRPLEEGVTYGFSLGVKNADSQSSQEDQLRWIVRTMDENMEAVEASERGAAWLDGVPSTNSSECWGLYSREIEAPRMRWGELQPFFFTMITGYVTVFPIQVPFDVKAPFRFTAPLGWVWEPEVLASGYWQDMVPGSTAPFPGSALPDPVVGKTFLVWTVPLAFNASQRYGFRAPIRVTWWPTTGTSFLMEFGLRGESFDSGLRPLAVLVPGPSALRVVRGAWVDYLTGHVNEEQAVRIQLTLAAPLYPQEGFVFEGGTATKRLECRCPAPLADGLTCGMTSERLSGTLVMKITSSKTLPSGTHSFLFRCTNPPGTYEAGTWKIGTYKEPDSYPNLIQVDAPATLTGFAIQAELPHFERLAPEATVGFDPRPLRNSSNIFAVTIPVHTQAEPGKIRLRAPEGTVFFPQCLDQIVTDLSVIFPQDATLASTYSQLPEVFRCEGRDHLAIIHWEAPLTQNVSFAFRVDAQNPEVQPEFNVWTLEAGGFSSRKVEGAIVQTFKQVSVEFTSASSRFQNSQVGGRLSNKLRLIFTPSVDAESMVITAPEGFDFGSGTDCAGLRLTGKQLGVAFAAPATLAVSRCIAAGSRFSVWFKMPDVNMSITQEYTFDADVLTPSDISQTSEHFLLTSTKVGGDVGDEIYVTFPALVRSPLLFDVRRTTNTGDEPRSGDSDSVDINLAFNNTINIGDTIRLTLPPNFVLDYSEMSCPVIVRQPSSAPSPECHCRGVSLCWIDFKVPILEEASRRMLAGNDSSDDTTVTTTGADSDENTTTSMPSTTMTMTRTTATVTSVTQTTTSSSTTQKLVFDDSCTEVVRNPPAFDHTWPCGSMLTLRVTFLYPPSVPTEFENAWMARLLAVPDEDKATAQPTQATELRSVGSCRGWTFETVMGETKVTLIDRGTIRAGAEGGVITVNFVPANPAQKLVINGKSPPSWDFQDVMVCELVGEVTRFCQAASSDASSPQVLALDPVDVKAGVPFRREIRNVKLAEGGGPAVFELNTFTRGQMGDEVDADSSGTINAFRLPGALEVSEVDVRTYRGMVTDPGDQIFQQLPPRLGLPETVISLHFSVTQAGIPGDIFSLEDMSGTFAMKEADASLKRLGRGFEIDVPIRAMAKPPSELQLEAKAVVAAGGAIHTLRIRASLRREIVLPPSDSNTTKWLSLVFLRQGEAWPINTNDAVLVSSVLKKENWASSGQLGPFVMEELVGAPQTQIQVSGTMPVPGEAPENLLMVAPAGIVFVAPCAPTPCQEIYSDWGGTGRQAILGLQPESSGYWALRVELPGAWENGNRNDWLLVVPEVNATSAVAAQSWTSADSISLRAMPAAVAYPAVAGTKLAELVVSMTPGKAALELIPGGARCYIEVVVPDGYVIHCGKHFRSLNPASPAIVECQVNDSGKEALLAMDNAKLQGLGELLFTFALDTPAVNPSENSFSLALLDAGNITLDANVFVPANWIPQPRLRGEVAFQVATFESLEWLQEWVAESLKGEVYEWGFMKALSVSRSSVSVDSVTANLGVVPPSSGRRLQGVSNLQGYVEVRYSLYADNGTSLEEVEALAGLPGFREALKDGVEEGLLIAGLTQLEISAVVTQKVPAKALPPNVTTPTLRWSTSEVNATGKVSVNLIFQASAEDSLGSILITLPSGYSHLLRSVADLEVIQRGAPTAFPLAPKETEGSCVETWDERNLRVILEKGATVAQGGYAFEIPFQMPSEDPVENIWEVSLCSGLYCDNSNHPSVITGFAFSGFTIGDAPNLLSSRNFVGSARRSHSRPTALIAFALTTATLTFLTGAF